MISGPGRYGLRSMHPSQFCSGKWGEPPWWLAIETRAAPQVIVIGARAPLSPIRAYLSPPLSSCAQQPQAVVVQDNAPKRRLRCDFPQVAMPPPERVTLNRGPSPLTAVIA